MKTKFIIQKAETYQIALDNIPKGYRIPKIWELFELVYNNKEIMEYEKGEWIFFWSSTKHRVYNNHNSVLVRDWDSGLYAGYWDLVSSDADGRVIYIEEKK